MNQRGLFRKNHWQLKRVTALLGFVGVLILSAVFLLNFGQAIGETVVFAFGSLRTPFLALNNKIAGFGQFLFSLKEMDQKNLDLRNENLSLLAEVAKVFELEKENEFLRASLNLEPKKDFGFVAAKVIGEDPSGVNHILTIDKGLKHGLEEGMAVVVSERILIGNVLEVKENFSYVRLLTDPQVKIAAITADTQVEGLLRGAFGSSLILDEIVKDQLIFIDELVLTSGKDGSFPSDFIVGRVRDIRFSKNNLFKEAVVAPLFDLNRLLQVLVVIPPS